MHIAIGSTAAVAVLAFVVGSARSADLHSGAPVAAPPAPTSTAQLPPGLNGVRPGPVSGGQSLDAGECRALGGTVRSAYPGICASGSMCTKRDNHGAAHAVCLSKQ
jgi:hypothetical protein